MASSSSSSTSSHSSWSSTAEALWVCQDPAMDHNDAFKTTQGNFEARLEALRASGVTVTSQVFELFEKVVDYIQSAYPNGIDLLGFRMHASEKRLPLSNQSGGSYSLEKPEEGLEAIENLFSRVRKFLMIEGCKTGFGKNGILKYLVSLCDPGVVGIGSKASKFEVGFDPTLSGYMRFECFDSKQDATRIYYKTKNGGVQNIPVEELMFLWDFLKDNCDTPEEKQKGFELCYKLLGERNDPATFSSIRDENKVFIDSVLGGFESIRKELLQVNVAKSGAKAIWVEMLEGLETLRCELGGDQERPEISVDEDERAKTPDQIIVTGGLATDSWTPYQRVYRFLLGCAFIDKYKALLMLLDDETRYGPASQAIKALSALNIHGNDKLSITTILAYYFPIIKKSYLAGKNSYLLKQWFEGISKGVCFNNMIKFIDDFYEERIRPSKEERLRIAISKNDEEEVWQLIEQGVDLTSVGLKIEEIPAVIESAMEQGGLFIAYLLLEQFRPKDEWMFTMDIQLHRRSNPFSAADKQFVLISKYLARKGKIKQLLTYAKLIKDPASHLNVLCEGAKTAAVLGEITQALGVLELFIQPTAPIHFRSDETAFQRSEVAYQIMEIALKLEEFTEALRAAELIPHAGPRMNAGRKIVDAMLKKKSQDEVIAFLNNSGLGSSVLYNRIEKLLKEDDYDQALKIANAIKDMHYFDKAYLTIVAYLLKDSKPSEAFFQAVRIKSECLRDSCLRDIVESLIKNLDLQAGTKDAELVFCYSGLIQLPKSYPCSLIAFLHLSQPDSDGEPKFISDLALGYQTFHRIPELDRQVGFISKYLLAKGEVEQALNYAKLIKTLEHQLNMIGECAYTAATLGNIVLEQEAKQLYNEIKSKSKIERKKHTYALRLSRKIKSFKIDLKNELCVQHNAMEKYEKAKMDFVAEFNGAVKPLDVPDLTLETFHGICVDSGCDINRMQLLNVSATPKLEAVIQAYQAAQEAAKKVDELQVGIREMQLELSANKTGSSQ